MTTPWPESTLFGGWARAQIPPPIESGVDLPSATLSVSLSTNSDRITVSSEGGPSRVVVAAFDGQLGPSGGVQEHRLPREWFRSSFAQRWAYTLLVRYRSGFRSLVSGWLYRLFVRFHPVLREVARTYAARIAAVSPSNRARR